MIAAEATVDDRLVIGPLTRFSLSLPGSRMTAVQMTDASGAIAPGDRGRLGIPADAVRVYAPLGAELAAAFGEHA